MNRDEALQVLAARFGPDPVAGVEAVAATFDADRPARTKPAVEPTDDELRAALLLLPEHLATLQRRLIVAARTPGENGRARLTWDAIGGLLGYPPGSSKQRARQLADRLGVLRTMTDPAEDTP